MRELTQIIADNEALGGPPVPESPKPTPKAS